MLGKQRAGAVTLTSLVGANHGIIGCLSSSKGDVDGELWRYPRALADLSKGTCIQGTEHVGDHIHHAWCNTRQLQAWAWRVCWLNCAGGVKVLLALISLR